MERTVTKVRLIRLIPITEIVVPHTGGWGDARNIGARGICKPILINSRNHALKGKYELICGKGQMLAHKKLGRTKIYADVIDVDEQTADLLSLTESVTRAAKKRR